MLPSQAVWFITGCSTGIGAAIAKHVHDKGHRLVVTARNPSTLSYLPDSNGNDTAKSTILKLPLDVCDKSSMNSAIGAALNYFGRIDVLVNVAGINTLGIAEALPEETLRRAMETNFWGPMHLTRKAVGVFRDVNSKSGEGGIGGTVVNVTSIGGRIALPAEAGYHASKFALEGFTESIAAEMDPAWNIRMMILEPGGTKSRFVEASAASRGPSHPAYTNPELPVNLMLNALTDPSLIDRLVDASEVAKCLFDTLQKDKIPLRLPTGKDAYDVVLAKESAKVQELKNWKEISESVGAADIPT